MNNPLLLYRHVEESILTDHVSYVHNQLVYSRFEHASMHKRDYLLLPASYTSIILAADADKLVYGNIVGPRAEPFAVELPPCLKMVVVELPLLTAVKQFGKANILAITSQYVGYRHLYSVQEEELAFLFERALDPAIIMQVESLFLPERAHPQKLDVLDPVIAKLEGSSAHVEVGDLADLIGYSKRQLHQIFHDCMGISIKLYSNLLRFERATELLAMEDKAVIQVVNELGYYDQSHFIRDFKKFTGMTPLEYQKHYVSYYSRLHELFW